MGTDLSELWREWWNGDIWVAPWLKAIDGLTAEQAAWVPTDGKHSIWQYVNHVMYWRVYTLDLIAGVKSLNDDPKEDENFAAPAIVDEASWEATKEALHHSHERMLIAIDDESVPNERLRYHLAHDAYHLGQIMVLRGLQGMEAVL